jgi:hypothetical protein
MSLGYDPHIWSSILHPVHKTNLERQRCAEHRLLPPTKGATAPVSDLASGPHAGSNGFSGVSSTADVSSPCMITPTSDIRIMV